MKIKTKLNILNNLNRWLRIKAVHFTLAVIIGISIITRDIYVEAKPFDFNNYVDLSVVFSVIITFIGSVFVGKLLNLLQAYLEDYVKLERDYNKLLKLYGNSINLISYENPANEYFRRGRKSTSMVREKNKGVYDSYRFPVTLEYDTYKLDFKLDDKNTRFCLPEIVCHNYGSIFQAHARSNTYNSLCIRLDGYKVINNQIILMTSRTTFFESLVTNRAVDYLWAPNLSLRKIYSLSGNIDPLGQSPFSNHLGYNGIVLTSDRKVIFIKRSQKVSIGKNTWATSIGASLKTKYALDKHGSFTLEGLINSIKCEISDELSISRDSYEFTLNRNILAVYRDLVEGGKPQMLFFIQCNIDSMSILNNFNIFSNNHKKNEKLIRDGKELAFIDLKDLMNAYITPDLVMIRKKIYHMVPSATASIVLFLKHMNR